MPEDASRDWDIGSSDDRIDEVLRQMTEGGPVGSFAARVLVHVRHPRSTSPGFGVSSGGRRSSCVCRRDRAGIGDRSLRRWRSGYGPAGAGRLVHGPAEAGTSSISRDTTISVVVARDIEGRLFLATARQDGVHIAAMRRTMMTEAK